MQIEELKKRYKEWDVYISDLEDRIESAKEERAAIAEKMASFMIKPVPDGGSASEEIAEGVKVKAFSTIKPLIDKDKYDKFMNSERANELKGLFVDQKPKLNNSAFKKLIQSNKDAMESIGASYTTSTKYTVEIS